jgi:hypothetical protein
MDSQGAQLRTIVRAEARSGMMSMGLLTAGRCGLIAADMINAVTNIVASRRRRRAMSAVRAIARV